MVVGVELIEKRDVEKGGDISNGCSTWGGVRHVGVGTYQGTRTIRKHSITSTAVASPWENTFIATRQNFALMLATFSRHPATHIRNGIRNGLRNGLRVRFPMLLRSNSICHVLGPNACVDLYLRSLVRLDRIESIQNSIALPLQFSVP